MRAAKSSIAVLIVSVSAFLSAQVRGEVAIEWLRDLESAKRFAAHTNRPILLHFWSPYCAPCIKLDQEVYARPEVKRAMEAMFVLVRLNVDNDPATASLYGVKSWPTDVILAPDGRLIAQLKCPPVAAQYLAQLQSVARGGGQLAAPAELAAGVSNPALNDASTPLDARQFGPPEAMNRVEQYNWGSADHGRSAATSDVSSAYSSAPHAAQLAPFTGASPQHVAAVSFQSADSQEPLAQQFQQAPLSQYAMVPANAAPPLALDGCCPVQLYNIRNLSRNDPRFKYTKGDARYGVVHRGRTYLFSSPAAQQEFLRDPDRFSPVMSGDDPVLLIDEGKQVPGTRHLGLFFGDRVYLFASEQSQAKFMAEKRKYAEMVYQAENPGRGMLR